MRKESKIVYILFDHRVCDPARRHCNYCHKLLFDRLTISVFQGNTQREATIRGVINGNYMSFPTINALIEND